MPECFVSPNHFRKEKIQWPPRASEIVLTPRPRHCYFAQVLRMNPAQSSVMHEVLPSEIMGVIFEEHAKLEWKAPVIDGQVCRCWRQIVLNTPRVWAYLEIRGNWPRVEELGAWFHRSGTAPLHIRVDDGSTSKLVDLLNDHHTRIASLRMAICDPSFFEHREFPSLRLLDVRQWHPHGPPARWGFMPTLRSLRSGPIDGSMVEQSVLASLELLALYKANNISLQRHYISLTTLMLDDLTLGDVISAPIDFPSLTYLSLWNMAGLKPHINAPCLTTYHEGGGTQDESFSAPLCSLVEYGIYGPGFSYSAWSYSFPILSRLSIRAESTIIISFLGLFSNFWHLFPALRTISVASVKFQELGFTQEDREIMMAKVHDLDVVLHFEVGVPVHIPIFFGEVGNCPPDYVRFLTIILGPGIPYVRIVDPSSAPIHQVRSTACIEEGTPGLSTADVHFVSFDVYSSDFTCSINLRFQCFLLRLSLLLVKTTANIGVECVVWQSPRQQTQRACIMNTNLLRVAARFAPRK